MQNRSRDHLAGCLSLASIVCVIPGLSAFRKVFVNKKANAHGAGRGWRLIAQAASANTFLLTGVNTRGNFTLKTGP